MIQLSNGQLATSATAILQPQGSTTNVLPIAFQGGRLAVHLYNNNAASQTIVLTQKISGGSVRHLYTLTLAQNQSADVGVAMGLGDTLYGQTTTASAVDFLISDSSIQQGVTVYNASGLPLSPTSTTIPPAQYTTGTTTTTFAAGQLTGAQDTFYVNTQATPGTITTRTATQMFGDFVGAYVGLSYALRITNGQGTGTLTVGLGSGVTNPNTSTLTIASNTWRDFVVTFTSTTAATLNCTGVGTYS